MRSLLTIPLLGAGVLLAACGSSSSTSTSASSASPSKTSAGLAFAHCMRAHGVPNFPDPPTNGRGLDLRLQAQGGSLSVNGVTVNAPAFQAAQKSCRSLLPNGGSPPPLSAARKQAMLRFSQCMRAHGISGFPDPTFSGGTVGIEITRSSGLNPRSPAFQTAQKSCQSILAAAGFAPKPASAP